MCFKTRRLLLRSGNKKLEINGTKGFAKELQISNKDNKGKRTMPNLLAQHNVVTRTVSPVKGLFITANKFFVKSVYNLRFRQLKTKE